MPDISHTDPNKQRIIDTTIRAGHGHVFRWWDNISEEDKTRLIRQLSAVDFDTLHQLFRQHKEDIPSLPRAELRPATVIPVPRNETQITAAKRAAQIGEDAIRAGEVAVFVVAGGQATRLGMDAPKGTLPITPIRKKSLFQHHIEKIRALSRKYKTRLPFYVMTSETNHAATMEYFHENSFFGLERTDVFLFPQEMIPALDLEGRLILDAKEHIFTNPNGHGGSISSLYSSGACADMRSRGIKYVFYFQVDNVLVKIADPVFLGYHVENRAEMSAKVTPKRDPEEKVGVVCHVGEAITVIEYSDLPDRYRHARNEDGSLRFSAGNIAIHILNVDFIERLNIEKRSLPFHIAEKAIPYLDDNGRLVRPDGANGLKFEKFVFDALGCARATTIMETVREEEFAPIKNAEGEDSPATAHDLMTNLYARRLEAIGVHLPRDPEGKIAGALEISPLFALDEDELRENLPDSFEPKFPLYLGPP